MSSEIKSAHYDTCIPVQGAELTSHFRRFALDTDVGGKAETVQRPFGTAATPHALSAAVVGCNAGELAVACGASVLQVFVLVRL